MKNYLMVLQYDGTSYNGWQKQGNNTNTIQGLLESTLSQLLQEEIEIHGSGRTDAFVHAIGQTANFKCCTIYDLQLFLTNVNKALPDDIRINRICEVDMGFHSRLSAVKKCYQYNISNGEKPSVFLRKYTYYVEKKLDVNLMRQAAKAMLGTHDFRGFSSEKNLSKSCVRELYDILIEENKNQIVIRFWGNGFIYNMVRIITGTLIEIGAGKRSVEDINKVFETGRRELAGGMVPANGLFLEKVFYKEDK